MNVFFVGFYTRCQRSPQQFQSMSYLARNKALEGSKCYSSQSNKTREDSSSFCCSCKSSKEDMQSQISLLKDKAHQSFMQVLQIQQLHDEELTLLREEFQEKEARYLTEIELLRKAHDHLQGEMALLQKNANRHSCDVGTEKFVIDNIDAILCEEGDFSRLDESELMQFNDLLDAKNPNDFVNNLRRELQKDLKLSSSRPHFERLLALLKDQQEENCGLVLANEELTRNLTLAQTQLKSSKHSSDSVNKEIKFLSEQIKRLGNDKLRLERKVSEIERANDPLQASPTTPPSKMEPQVNFIQRNNAKSLSPNSTTERMKKSMDAMTFLRESCPLEPKREVNEVKYSNFMRADELALELDRDFKKRSSQLQRRKK